MIAFLDGVQETEKALQVIDYDLKILANLQYAKMFKFDLYSNMLITVNKNILTTYNTVDFSLINKIELIRSNPKLLLISKDNTKIILIYTNSIHIDRDNITIDFYDINTLELISTFDLDPYLLYYNKLDISQDGNILKIEGQKIDNNERVLIIVNIITKEILYRYDEKFYDVSDFDENDNLVIITHNKLIYLDRFNVSKIVPFICERQSLISSCHNFIAYYSDENIFYILNLLTNEVIDTGIQYYGEDFGRRIERFSKDSSTLLIVEYDENCNGTNAIILYNLETKTHIRIQDNEKCRFLNDSIEFTVNNFGCYI